jgi:hypothetical protein
MSYSAAMPLNPCLGTCWDLLSYTDTDRPVACPHTLQGLYKLEKDTNKVVSVMIAKGGECALMVSIQGSWLDAWPEYSTYTTGWQVAAWRQPGYNPRRPCLSRRHTWGSNKHVAQCNYA